MKCLVTGGASFIGSHLVDRLMKDGHGVVVLDNFSTGRQENLAHHGKASNLSVNRVDIAGFKDIQPLFRGIDWVFHIASLADIVPSIQQPQAYHHANVDGTFSVLEAARLPGDITVSTQA